MTESTDTSGIPEDPREWKIYPRNLTARAATIVPGNPVTSRPETAIDNCYPGLEMDARNIQKHFFPGMSFDVYGGTGARLAELTPPDQARAWLDLGLKPEDLEVSGGLFLWGLKGRVTARQDPEDPPTISFAGVDATGAPKDGLYAWRKAADLFPGSVAIALGPGPAATGAALESALIAASEVFAGASDASGRVQRDSDGRLEWAVFCAPRARYLDEEGVLDPDVYRPGELTRTLCTPWTYDFRDCQCFYWASNKPDVVASEDGTYAYLNFQRKNRAVEPQTQDIANGYSARRGREIDYAEMMVDWEQLRPVVNGRERGESFRPEVPPPGKPLTLRQIKDEVSYLATVEHALAVQYLYAYYSIDAPYERPATEEVRDFRLWSAAQEVFQIAVDEMRHFRWANEILTLIGAPTTARRATELGRSFGVPFFLQSMSPLQLQWFVDLERPSRSQAEGLDGMYIGVLKSLQHLDAGELDPEKRRQAVEIAKLIVDEGEGHYLRFSSVQQNLSFYDGPTRGDMPTYVRAGQWRVENGAGQAKVPIVPLYGQPKIIPRSEVAALRELQVRSDALYQALLNLLKIAFAMGGKSALKHAISLMIRMNEINLRLAEGGETPLFTLPEGWDQDPPIDSPRRALEVLDTVEHLLAGEPDELPAEVRALRGGPASDAVRHGSRISGMLSEFKTLVRVESARF